MRNKGSRFVLQHHELWWNPISITVAGLYAAWKLAEGNADASFKTESSVIASEQWAREQKLQVLFFAFLLRQAFPTWGQSWWECFLVEGIQVLTLSASARLELAQRSLCHLSRGPTRVSSPYSEACGSRCCSLGSAGHFHPQFLKWEHDSPWVKIYPVLRNSSPRAFVSSFTTQVSYSGRCLPHTEPQGQIGSCMRRFCKPGSRPQLGRLSQPHGLW